MMRIHRIRITNCAGVTTRDVTFADTGITLISGQNESGKSTLFLALQALLDHPEDASHREVKALKPLHTGLTPEIEADLTIGPYRLTYSKSFGKGKSGATRLRIELPVPETLTGREAHDRVCNIIDNHLDRALWSAMRMLQGSAISQPSLGGLRSLSAALDLAIGNDKAGDREAHLLHRANQEHLQFWTAGGKPIREALELDKAASDAVESERSLRTKLQELEIDVTAHKAKTREHATAIPQTAGLAVALEKAAADQSHLNDIAATLQMKDLAVTVATQMAETAQSAVNRRQELKDDFAAAERAVQEAERARAAALELPEMQAAALKQLDQDRTSARSALTSATAVLDLADADVCYLQSLMDLTLLDARMQSIVQADHDAATAESTVKALRATKEAVAELNQTATTIAVAKAKLGAVSPKVVVKALIATRIQVNGTDTDLETGQTLSAPPAHFTRLTIGNVAELVVEGASDIRQWERDLTSATDTFQALLKLHGVETVEQVEDQRQRRERAIDQGAAARRAATEHLLDLTRETMRDKIARLTEATEHYPTQRQTNDSPLPADLFCAKRTADSAREALRDARSTLEVIELGLRSATAAAAESQTAAAVTDAQLKDRKARREQIGKSLQAVLANDTDAQLETRAADTTLAAAQQIAERDVIKDQYKQADPERVAAGLSAAQKAKDNHEANLRRIRDDLSRLRARLEVNGEAGIVEDLQKAARNVFMSHEAATRYKRRAQAAKLLFETLTDCREEAQKSYVEPLRKEIERLGKFIFGEDFGVVIGENLGVDARVINGTTIPYANLSSGAKEQIGILERLATARIVGKGGVPLILDDAVAYTDNVRQESLATAIGFASIDTQTIVVTCSPEKYTHAPIESRSPF
jgi:energy-coupling factor transporter ATP-binding protein EcfA2